MTDLTRLISFLDVLDIKDETLRQLAIEFSETYRHLALHSTDQFLATPVNVLPLGSEIGRFLAIDVGGSNLRVGFIELLGKDSTDDQKIRRRHERSWPIEEHLKRDNAIDLFDWIGGCIAQVVSADLEAEPNQRGGSNVEKDILPLGVTFSFPMIQTSISEATLMPMGKGFVITSDLNLGELLIAGYSRHSEEQRPENGRAHTGIARPKLPRLRIAAISNDAVATLASLAYTAKSSSNARVVMGIIVATGTNATTVMKLKGLHPSKVASLNLPFNAHIPNDEGAVVVNTEWTIRGTAPPLHSLKLVTGWDVELDRHCQAPGFQPFEYMTSGRYIGELIRLIVVDYLTTIVGVEPSQLPGALHQRNAISTFWLSNVVAKAESTSALVPHLTKSLPPPAESNWAWAPGSAEVLIVVTNYVRTRSARMHAAAVVGLLACTGEISIGDTLSDGRPRDSAQQANGEFIVAYAGGVIEQFPGYLGVIQGAINELISALAPTNKVRLQEAKDGGIIGAGVLAGTIWNLPMSSEHASVAL